ncbi:MAG: hypothetical protein AAF901_05260 [Bacteroidota bacterium]
MKPDQLKDINSAGFKVPDNYFDTFEAKLNARMASEKGLNDIEEAGFEVPKDYFETLDDKIMSQVSNDPPGQVISLFSRRNLLYLSGVAAALLVAFTVFFKSAPESLDDLDSEIVKTYLSDEEISSFELAALLTDEELSTINTEIMEEAFSDDDEIEDYLIDNTNLEDLIEQ